MVKFRLVNYYHDNARFGYQVILKIIKKTKKNKRQIFFPRRNAMEIQRALIMAFNHKKSVGRSEWQKALMRAPDRNNAWSIKEVLSSDKSSWPQNVYNNVLVRLGNHKAFIGAPNTDESENQQALTKVINCNRSGSQRALIRAPDHDKVFKPIGISLSSDESSSSPYIYWWSGSQQALTKAINCNRSGSQRALIRAPDHDKVFKPIGISLSSDESSSSPYIYWWSGSQRALIRAPDRNNVLGRLGNH